MSTVERTAIVRVDAEPSGKRFQGCWLDFGTPKRWVIAYRPYEVWSAFADREVVVTGHCYRPFGQAINARHFQVDTMRPLDPKDARRFLAVHPERLVRGTVQVAEAVAGSKLAEWPSLMQFVEEGGTTWWVAGSEDRPTVGRAITARLRIVDLSLSWTAAPGGPHVWIGATYGADYIPDPKYQPTPVPCGDDADD